MAESVGAAPAAKAGPSSWWAFGLILLGTIWLYVPALRTDFFADDYLFLDQVRGRSLLQALMVPDPLSNFFRPVSRQLYFWLVAGLTNESPVAFRVGNLVSLLVIIALMFELTRRLAGTRAACFAAAFLSLHYAPDVPVRWACGSQDLLAVVGAVAAILLHVSGRSRWAGVAMLFGALSKEVVLLTPVIAVIAGHRPRESWRQSAIRAWPLAAAVAVWALIWLSMPHRHVAQSTEVEFDVVQSPIAAFVHLFQVAAGIEWGRRAADIMKSLPPLEPLVAAIAAVVIVWRGGTRRSRVETNAQALDAKARGEGARDARPREMSVRDRRHAIVTGLVWALLATLPVAAVAILWSAYYYLFALCGVALVLGTLMSRRPLWAAAVVLAILAWGSANARWLQEFGVGRNAWTAVSHINDYYIERSNHVTDGYLASLRRKYPSLPSGSTVFFAGLAGNVAFQRADGPLLRWAYRDSSLRSYYLNTFSREKVRPGPVLFFVAAADSLRELEQDPELYLRLAFGMIVSDRPTGARDALAVAASRMPSDPRVTTWLGWAELALGDTASARASLQRAGARLDRGPTAETQAVLQRVSAGDTLGAIATMRQAVHEHALDPAAHALLADLLLVRNRRDPDAAIEAYAARTLAPQDPYVWRRWAMIQTDRERYLEALASFQSYYRYGGPHARADGEVERWVATIKSAIPKGEVESDVLDEMASAGGVQ